MAGVCGPEIGALHIPGELAKLYTDTGYWTLARAELDWVILLATDDDNGVRAKEKARTLLKRLGTEEEG